MTREATGHSLPRLLSPSDVARVLDRSEWWVKEQARRRRIPFAMLGGAYRFTEDHVHEIIRIFEHRPADKQGQAAVPAPRHRPVLPAAPVSPVIQLRARRPKRAPKAG